MWLRNQKLSKVLRHGSISLETKKAVINCYLISKVLYGSGWLTIPKEICRGHQDISIRISRKF